MLTSHSNDTVTPSCERVVGSDTASFENQIIRTPTLTPVNDVRNATSSTLLHEEPYYSFNQPLSHLLAIQEHCTPRGFSLPSQSFFFDMNYIIRLHTATYESVNDIILSNIISAQRSTAGTVNTNRTFSTDATFSINTTEQPNTALPSTQATYTLNNINIGSASSSAVRSWPYVRPTQRASRLFSSNRRASNSLTPQDGRTTSSSIIQTILSFLGLSSLVSTLTRSSSFDFESRRNSEVLRPMEYHDMPGVPRHLLQMLPAETFLFSSNESSLIGVCPVCHLDYVKYDRRKRLPCLHHFHAECIDKWLTTRRSCPVCRLCVMATLRETDALLYNDRCADQIIAETLHMDVPRAPDPIGSNLMNPLSKSILTTKKQTTCNEVPSSSSSSSSSSTIKNDRSLTPQQKEESTECQTGNLQTISIINPETTMRSGNSLAADVTSVDSSVPLRKNNSRTKQVLNRTLFQHDCNAQNPVRFAEEIVDGTLSTNSRSASCCVAIGNCASGNCASGSGAIGNFASGSGAIGNFASGNCASGSGASGHVGKGASGMRRNARVRFKVLENMVDTKFIKEEGIDDSLNTIGRLKEVHVEQACSTMLSDDVYTKTPRSFYTRPTCFILNPSSRCSFILNDGLSTDACHTSNF